MEKLGDEAVQKPMDSNSIPMIDMELLLANINGDSRELEKLHLACKDWGFFQIINHGVSTSLLEKLKKEAQGFFKQPLEEMKKFEILGDNIYKEGYGQMLVNEQNWADRFSIHALPANLRNPHLFPKLPASSRDTMEEYFAQMKGLSEKILNAMGKALRIEAEEETLNAVFDEAEQTMNIYQYPKCPEPGVVMGLNPHTDAAGLTIVFQANQVEGLHVKKDGAWIPVTPLPNALVVNVGDMIEIATNGIYKGVEHRVLYNPNEERHSVVTFFKPKRNRELSPARSLITPQNPAKFKRNIGTVADYLKVYFTHRVARKSYIHTLRMETEHEYNN